VPLIITTRILQCFLIESQRIPPHTELGTLTACKMFNLVLVHTIEVIGSPVSKYILRINVNTQNSIVPLV